MGIGRFESARNPISPELLKLFIQRPMSYGRHEDRVGRGIPEDGIVSVIADYNSCFRVTDSGALSVVPETE